MTQINDHKFPGDNLNAAIDISCDERDAANGNASHAYTLSLNGANPSTVFFQHGARNEEGSTPGVTDAALVTVLLDRYRGFQSGDFACRENAIVVTKLEETLMWMQKRIRDRQARGVLGKNQK